MDTNRLIDIVHGHADAAKGDDSVTVIVCFDQTIVESVMGKMEQIATADPEGIGAKMAISAVGGTVSMSDDNSSILVRTVDQVIGDHGLATFLGQVNLMAVHYDNRVGKTKAAIAKIESFGKPDRRVPVAKGGPKKGKGNDA